MSYNRQSERKKGETKETCNIVKLWSYYFSKQEIMGRTCSMCRPHACTIHSHLHHHEKLALQSFIYDIPSRIPDPEKRDRASGLGLGGAYLRLFSDDLRANSAAADSRAERTMLPRLRSHPCAGLAPSKATGRTTISGGDRRSQTERHGEGTPLLWETPEPNRAFHETGWTVVLSAH
uniref:Uncharacterized protein n=1 Tax=Oryza sativa subsp. japonica TaxID=39947 RepID=Q10NB8_ORYSJ|nr:hypothetical protein LOC_Os03g16770 [Oryza sativa Japonica Group]